MVLSRRTENVATSDDENVLTVLHLLCLMYQVIYLPVNYMSSYQLYLHSAPG